MDNLKGDLTNGAFDRLRISGLTVDPTAFDNTKALRRLESMMAEFLARNINVSYAFEDDPDLATPHNVPIQYWDPIESLLAKRLLPDYGKGFQPDPSLFDAAKAGMSFLYSATAQPRQTQYPSRQPMGAANTLRFRRRRFYGPSTVTSYSATTNQMIVGDINDYVEHFDSFLVASEDISSFTITADTGLTIVSSSLTTPDVSYRIQADGDASEDVEDPYQVKIVATTDTGRIITRLIRFELTDLRDSA